MGIQPNLGQSPILGLDAEYIAKVNALRVSLADLKIRVIGSQEVPVELKRVTRDKVYLLESQPAIVNGKGLEESCTNGIMVKPETQVRHVDAREVTFTCAHCGKTVTQWRFPGPLPKYCSDECKGEARREAQRELMRRKRSLLPPKKRGRPPKNEKVRDALPVKPSTPEP